MKEYLFRSSLVFCLVLLSIPLFVSAEVTSPYTWDAQSQILFGDSVTVSGYLGLENYVANYVGGYLHITFTSTHHSCCNASNPPYLYVTNVDPQTTASPTVLNASLSPNVNHWDPSDGGTDVYFYDIQFNPTGYVANVIKGVGGGLWNSATSTITDLTPDSYVALANNYLNSNCGGRPCQYAMSFEPMKVSIPPSAPFYSKIENTGSGAWNFRSGSSTSASLIKTLPEDWVLYVSSTTDSTGAYITANGYHWYQVIDPTDNVSGWMAAEDASSTAHYLSYKDNQSELATTSSIFVDSSSTPGLILAAIDDYYGTSTGISLYDEDSDVSTLKSGSGYPKQIIPGIVKQEDGGIFELNNDNVSSDYGHGLMQITFATNGSFDNRGVGSKVTIPPCTNSDSSYTSCYTSPDSGNHNLRTYITYKQYASTTQSIYANIKDGLTVLGNWFGYYNYINTSTTTDGTTFSANDRQVISATESYNDGVSGSNCGYVDDIATALDNITDDFPSATTSEITSLIPKMHTAGGDVICAQLHSPADISIQDSNGRVVGIVNGKGADTFPLAIYDKNRKFAEVLAAEKGDYNFRVEGTGKGTYELDITIKHGKDQLKFRSEKIPVTPKEIHTYSIDKDAVAKGQKGVTIKVDTNGDGVVDKTIHSGLDLTGAEFTKDLNDNSQ